MHIAYFNEIIMDLPNASKEELMHAYIYRLKPYIKGKGTCLIELIDELDGDHDIVATVVRCHEVWSARRG